METDTVETKAETSEEKDDKKPDVCQSQPKRRKVESSSENKESGRDKGVGGETKTKTTPLKDEAKPQEVDETTEDQKPTNQKRSLSRQSSQESARSSSPSSGCSTSTLTRHAHHKRTYENRHPTKRKRMDTTSEAGKEEDEKKECGEKDHPTAASRRRRSRSPSSSSSDSDSGDSRKEHRITRSAKRMLQDQEKEKGTKERKGTKPACSSDRNASNANASTGGESGSDTSSVRITRKSAGSQPPQDTKTQTNSAPSLPPEPEVLGKRCSALNAAAKLLAMKGRVDTPGHTPRKDSAAKAAATSTAASSDKTPKPKSKSVPVSPQSNSVTNNKSSKASTPNQASRSASRSTRQCPGSLVPPLEVEYKRPKPEEKERGSRKSSRGKEGEGEMQSSSRGHSACSSMSSDGEGDCGGRSSRSRSSSNSSQRTHSISSQNTEHRGSRSRATSSGSERERDRSPERAKSRDKKEKQSRESQKDGRRSQKLSQEVTSSSGTEGSTPDRVLRSVAALAAVQARSPAASTRSSSSQQRHNKT